MKSFVVREGSFSPIKFFLTILWFMFLTVFFLLIVTIIMMMKGKTVINIELVQVLMQGVTALTVQLVATTGLDTWRQNVKTKGERRAKSQDGNV